MTSSFIGIYEKGVYPPYENGRNTKLYKLWANMLKRCYYAKGRLSSPTYEGCTVSEDFKYFQKFAAWCVGQTGFGLSGFQLDKDILCKGE